MPLLPCYSYQYIYILHGVRSSTWHSFGRCTADVINRRINWQPLGLLPPPRHPQCQQLSLSGHTEGESSSNVTLKTDVSYTCSRSQRVTQHRKGSVCSLPVTGLTHRVSNQHTAQTELSLPSLHTADSPAASALEGDAEGLWGENVAGCLHGSSRSVLTQWIWHVCPAPASFCTPLAKPDSLLPGLATCLPRWQRRRHALADYWSVRWRRPRFLFLFFLFPFYHSFKVFMRMTGSTGIYLYIYSFFLSFFIYSALWPVNG